MGFKGSGVYAEIFDNSVVASSSGQGATCIIPMLTKRGNEFEEVTLDTLISKVGFDLSFNTGYLGLLTLLQTMASVTVMRLNKNATAGNLLIFQSGRSMSMVGVSQPDLIAGLPVLYQDQGVVFSTTVTRNYAVHILAGTVKVYNGTTLVAEDTGGAGTLTAVGSSGITGSVTYNGGTSPANATVTLIATGTHNLTVAFTPDETVALAVAMNTVGNWGPISVSLAPTAQATTQSNPGSGESLTIPGFQVATGSIKILNAGVQIAHDSAGVLVADNGSGVTGTVTYGSSGTSATVNFTTAPSGQLLTVNYTPTAATAFTLTVYQQTGLAYSAIETINFSTDPASPIYLPNFVPTNVVAEIVNGWSTDLTVGSVSAPALLGNASDGLALNSGGSGGILPTDIDVSVLAGRTETFIVMNGLTDIRFQNVFRQYADQTEKFFVLCDAPDFSTYDATASWATGLFPTYRSTLTAVTDTLTTSVGSVPVYPSIKVMQAYSSMYSRFGSLKYPPAGNRYGVVSMTKIQQTDFASHASDLKTHKINYIRASSAGAVIWEQRTGYGLESDLSYASTVFVLDDIGINLKAVLNNFVFIYIGPSELNMIDSAFKNFMDTQVTSGYVWSYRVDTPTFASIKARGVRQATIPVTVQVAQDGEEWTINIYVSGTQVSQ